MSFPWIQDDHGSAGEVSYVAGDQREIVPDSRGGNQAINGSEGDSLSPRPGRKNCPAIGDGVGNWKEAQLE